MKVFSLVLLGVCGWIGTASPAHAGDVSIDVGLGFRDGRLRGGAFGIELGGAGRPARAPRGSIVFAPVRPRPPHVVAPFRPYGTGIVVDPAFPAFPRPGHGHADDCACDRTYIPAHTVCREETVCVPAVYEDRCVPVYDTRCVPVYETVCVPVTEWVIDPRTGRRHEVVVGERKERMQVGERHETVKVGERHERVLVVPETTRVVTRHETVPGRWVTICDGGHAGGHAGEVLTSAAFRLEMASIEHPSVGGSTSAGAYRLAPRGTGRGIDDGWYTGDRR